MSFMPHYATISRSTHRSAWAFMLLKISRVDIVDLFALFIRIALSKTSSKIKYITIYNSIAFPYKTGAIDIDVDVSLRSYVINVCAKGTPLPANGSRSVQGLDANTLSRAAAPDCSHGPLVEWILRLPSAYPES